MFCEQCGKPLDATARFCGSCGARTPLKRAPSLSPGRSDEISAAVAKQSLASHLRVMGILWAIYSGFRILMAFWTIVFARVFFPTFMDVITKAMSQQNGATQTLHPLYSRSGT